jgi:hypothetical protein
VRTGLIQTSLKSSPNTLPSYWSSWLSEGHTQRPSWPGRSDDTPRRVKRETCEKGAIRSSKLWVRSSENLELRTSNRRPSRPSRQSRLAILRGCSPLSQDVPAIEVLPCPNSFFAAC